jgi:hypothetical protein
MATQRAERPKMTARKVWRSSRIPVTSLVALTTLSIVCNTLTGAEKEPSSRKDSAAHGMALFEEQGAARALIEQIRLDFESGRETRHQTLERLALIATSSNSVKTMGGVEIYALAQFADNDVMAQDYLLGVFTSTEADAGKRWIAAKVLTYFLDESGRARMLEHIEQEWQQRKEAVGLEALVEVGDLDTLAWLEQRLLELREDDPARARFEEYADTIRLVHDRGALLAAIENEDSEHYHRRFAIKQALRQGVSPAEIRRRVLAMIDRLDGKRRAATMLGIADLCDAAGVLTPDDKHNNETVRQALKSWAFMKGESVTIVPDWASAKVLEKEAEFYRFNTGKDTPGE